MSRPREGASSVRQPPDRARHGRDHAPRRPHRPGAHRGRLEPRPDAQPAVPGGKVPLVNIVRKPEQEEILRALGAELRLQLDLADVHDRAHRRPEATSATLAFDAIGGGKLASQILTGMEAAATTKRRGYSRYGSRPTSRSTSTAASTADRPSSRATSAWPGASAAGCSPRSSRASDRPLSGLRERVAAGLKTTFASTYTKEVSLARRSSPTLPRLRAATPRGRSTSSLRASADTVRPLRPGFTTRCAARCEPWPTACARGRPGLSGRPAASGTGVGGITQATYVRELRNWVPASFTYGREQIFAERARRVSHLFSEPESRRAWAAGVATTLCITWSPKLGCRP